MGYKKTIQRNSISGLFEHNDIPDGEHSVNELRARAEARHQALSDAYKNDGPSDMTSTKADIEDPAYGNAGEKFPRPTDYSSKGQDRFGISVTPGKQSVKDAPRSNSKQSKQANAKGRLNRRPRFELTVF